MFFKLLVFFFPINLESSIIVGIYLKTCYHAKCRILGIGDNFYKGNILGVQMHSLTQSTYSALICIYVSEITVI